jgi:hypothetical protein
MTRVDDCRWRAAFHATFGKVLKACYSTELVIDGGTDLVLDRGPERSAAPECTFKGSSDLGVFGGGVYEYAAEVAGDVFTSTFRSRTDHGTFRMRRV